MIDARPIAEGAAAHPSSGFFKKSCEFTDFPVLEPDGILDIPNGLNH